MYLCILISHPFSKKRERNASSGGVLLPHLVAVTPPLPSAAAPPRPHDAFAHFELGHPTSVRTRSRAAAHDGYGGPASCRLAWRRAAGNPDERHHLEMRCVAAASPVAAQRRVPVIIFARAGACGYTNAGRRGVSGRGGTEDGGPAPFVPAQGSTRAAAVAWRLRWDGSRL